MSAHLIAITGLIYLYVCVEQAMKGNVGMAVAYGGYAASNVGLCLLAR